MRLLLIYPEIECSITNTSTYSLPLGLGSVATNCKQNLGDLEVRILDSSIMSHEEQLEEIRRLEPDYTGISPTIASMNNGYELGRLAKDLGSLVFFGGVNTTNLHRQMLMNREFIDGVILGEGEKAMLNILKGKWDSVLDFGASNLDELPDIDYSLFDMDRFLKQTEERGFGRAVSYYGGKGCAKRERSKACTFCGRNEIGFRVFPAEREAKVIRELYKKYGIEGFFNVQDTVCLEEREPIGIDAWFRLFIGLEAVNERNISVLKKRYGENLIF